MSCDHCYKGSSPVWLRVVLSLRTSETAEPLLGFGRCLVHAHADGRHTPSAGPATPTPAATSARRACRDSACQRWRPTLTFIEPSPCSSGKAFRPPLPCFSCAQAKDASSLLSVRRGFGSGPRRP